MQTALTQDMKATLVYKEDNQTCCLLTVMQVCFKVDILRAIITYIISAEITVLLQITENYIFIKPGHITI